MTGATSAMKSDEKLLRTEELNQSSAPRRALEAPLESRAQPKAVVRRGERERAPGVPSLCVSSHRTGAGERNDLLSIEITVHKNIDAL
eukprot:scaffold4414_cov65-Phaeocystis_antarctica.AAC.6